eukprot:TRINITY_DN4012_c0_g3_i1.p1 TRINITY_DN4012_c0_g3~~TRINITY_DN4012_c0_g3_i1.p1  ORF type:complete len:136 (-),score=17.55 TRINITY_DN4012_c0_g3_i1:45-452(-)
MAGAQSVRWNGGSFEEKTLAYFQNPASLRRPSSIIQPPVTTQFDPTREHSLTGHAGELVPRELGVPFLVRVKDGMGGGIQGACRSKNCKAARLVKGQLAVVIPAQWPRFVDKLCGKGGNPVFNQQMAWFASIIGA